MWVGSSLAFEPIELAKHRQCSLDGAAVGQPGPLPAVDVSNGKFFVEITVHDALRKSDRGGEIGSQSAGPNAGGMGAQVLIFHEYTVHIKRRI